MRIKHRHIQLLLFIFLFISCEKEYHPNTIDCEYCFFAKPSEGELVISLTINDKYPYVPITVYKDVVENENVIFYNDSVNETPFYVYVPLPEHYSVTAEYIDSVKKITVLDRDKIRTKYVTGSCDESCWMIKGGYIDVTLKEYK